MLGDIQRYCKQHVAELREYSPGFKKHAVRNHDPTDFLDRLIQEVRRFDWVDSPHTMKRFIEAWKQLVSYFSCRR